MNKSITLLVLLLLVIPLIPAEEVYRQNQPINIIHSITLNGFPSSTISANITISDPFNEIVAVGTMEFNSNNHQYQYNLTIGNTSRLGLYEYCISASDSGLNKTECFNYEVTLTGDKPTTAQSNIYWVIAFVSIILFLLSLTGAILIPYGNKKNEQGYIVQMNDLKYIKLLLWFITYLILTFITFAFSNISQVANWDVAYRFLNFLFISLISFMLPVFILLIVFSFIRFWEDKKTKQLLNRNLGIR